MNSSWRFAPGQGEHSAASLGNAPDWVAPFLELDQRFQSGQAQALSSGSTGPPKELTFDVNWIRASALATESHFGLQLKPRSAPLLAWSPLPMAGVGGRMMWWRTRILGWDLTQNQPSSSPVVPAPPQGQERYDFAVATPQQAQALLQNGSLSRLSILLIGGAPIPASLEARLLQGANQFGCAIHHGFGMTETLTHVATRPLGESNYRALDGVEFKISAQGALEIHSPCKGGASPDHTRCRHPSKRGSFQRVPLERPIGSRHQYRRNQGSPCRTGAKPFPLTQRAPTQPTLVFGRASTSPNGRRGSSRD